VTSSAAIRAAAEKLDIQAGQILEGLDATFRAAGRIVLYRDIGRLIFLTVRDQSGELQFGLSKKMLVEGAEGSRGAGAERTESSLSPGPVERRTLGPSDAETLGPSAPRTLEPSARPGDEQAPWKVAKLLDLGDVVGADGRLGRTKTGELTLWVTKLTLLSKALRPPPAKWHGLTDVELRYRRRYVDLFANPESRRVFVQRARIIDYARRVLHERGFIEVDTPVLQPIYGGAAARPFLTHHNTLDLDLYLRISPELYLKRCLVGGLERVYEFSRCFRNEGISPRHNPEFTMLELYQAYGDYHDMMDLCEAIIGGAARDVIGTCKIAPTPRSHEATQAHEEAIKGGVGVPPASLDDWWVIDYTPPWARLKYADAFRKHVGIPIDDIAAVRARARDLKSQISSFPDEGKLDDALVIHALFEHFVEDRLINPTFVLDWPAPLCPLTKRDPHDPNTALRFELFINGTEIGNAYSELNDPAVQRATFSRQLRGEGDETMAVMDEDFCEALEYGMPPAGGLGIGIDRLVMLLTGSPSIRDVLLFPLQRPETSARERTPMGG
jgi:lysyl-tRNA synthetase class 2